MTAYQRVKEGTIEIRYSILEYDIEDGSKVYDWQTSNGDDSDELFDSIEDAVYDVEHHYG